MHVIATAGHIDHGKSTLVKSLTGIDPDRLPEEKERGLTIDLGFAWLELPSGELVGIVDVPGHERFIKNMVAGVGSIDAVLFVVAADDGWMPQSTEHLQILSLLDIKIGAIILTKTDMVDNQTLENRKQEIAIKTKGTFLENAPIIPFSAANEDGKSDIILAIDKMLRQAPPRKNLDSPRLYVDRVFSITGSGTIVTGTLIDGAIEIGQELEICPQGEKFRVRGLQVHNRMAERVVPVSRVAVNVAGLSREDIDRGSAVVLPGKFQPVSALAATIKTLPDLKPPLKNNARLKFYLGTTGTLATVRLLDYNQLDPDSEGIAIIRLDNPICCRIGDKFIIRQTSPQATIGGGTVLDWNFDEAKIGKTELLNLLQKRKKLDLQSLVETDLFRFKRIDIKRLKTNSCFRDDEIETYLNRNPNLLKSGKELVEKNQIEKFVEPFLEVLIQFHRQQPWAEGMLPGDIARKLKIKPQELSGIVDYMLSNGKVEQKNGLVKISGHIPSLRSDQRELANRLIATLSARPLAAPLKKEFITDNPAYEIIIDFLCQQGDLVELGGGVLFTQNDFQKIAARVTGFLANNGKATAAQIKDHLGTTRKYLIPLLEKLDSLGITRREGDYRTLGESK